MSLDEIADRLIDAKVPQRPQVLHWIERGYRGKDRSKCDWRVVSALIRAGLTDEEIHAIYAAYAIGTQGKFNERGAGYLALTLQNARQKAEQPEEERPVDGGIRVHDGCMWKATEEGEVLLANFVLTPTALLRVEDGQELYHCQMTLPGQAPYPVALGRPHLSGKREFLHALPSAQAAFFGNDGDVQRLVMYLNAQKAPRLKGTQKVGWNGDLFVTPEVVLGPAGEIPPPAPVVYVPTHVAWEREIHIRTVPNWGELAQGVLTLLPQLHEPVAVWRAAGWFFASFLAPMVRAELGHFPLLQLWGSRGVGKTTMARYLWRLTGCTGAERSCMSPHYSLMREIAVSSSVPLVLDEYRPGDIPDSRLRPLHGLLRMCYDAQAERRGRNDPGRPVEVYTLTAPLCIVGEAPFTDGALIERSVIVPLSANWIPDHREVCGAALAQLERLPLEDFAGGLVQFLRAVDVPEVLGRALAASKQLEAAIRVQHGIAVVLLGLEVMNRIAAVVRVPPVVTWEAFFQVFSLAAMEENVGRVESPLDIFIRAVVRLLLDRDISEAEHYLLKDDVLYLDFSYLVDKLAFLYGRGRAVDLGFSREPLRRAINEDRRFVADPPFSHVHFPLRRVRALALNAAQLEEHLGIDRRTWTSQPLASLVDRLPEL